MGLHRPHPRSLSSPTLRKHSSLTVAYTERAPILLGSRCSRAVAYACVSAATAHREDPVAQTNGLPHTPRSPAQLAPLLTKSLQGAETLKSELAQVKRRADKAERPLAAFQASSQTASPNG